VTVPGPASVSASARGARELFRSRFGAAPDGIWLAPGRANLMGEHTDYNDGYVLPFALGQGVAVAAGLAAGQESRRLVLCSRQEPGCLAEITLDGLAPGQVSGWAAYPAGVAWALESSGYQVPGTRIAVDSDLPAGAGLSSSAALECAAALALTSLALTSPALTSLAGPADGPEGEAESIPRRELAAIARRAENEFVGVPSGIMDQSASLLCQAGHALLLDCRSLQSSQVPFDPARAGSRLLLINTRARHELTAGQYGQRRAECEQAARLLGVPSLRYLTDVGETERLPDPVLRRRARHVVTDNQRVLEVVALLRSPAGDVYPQVGRLLTRAHLSLRDDFEVSWPEADVAVDAALDAGALGTRMMGGGFGGSVLALAREGTQDAVRAVVAAAFARRSWTSPGFVDAAPSASARRLGLQWVRHEPRRKPVPVREEAAQIADQVAGLRHAIHREPEIGLDLPKTQQKVLGALDGLPLEISTGKGLSSVTAVLRGGRPGPTVLLRGDMDALPITEETGLPYASAIPGAMHACGHDMHTAMLAGAARLLSGRKADLPGTVIFMFQPGEEGYAGAKHMIAEGVLEAAGERPVAAYGLHVSSNRLTCGMFSTRPGPMLAAADQITVTVHGRGGHASSPHRAADPIPVACEMVIALQTLVTRKFDVFDPVVITVGSFHAGTTDNVIPDDVRFLASARSFSQESRSALAELVPRLIGDIARAHGLTAEAHYAAEYPVTVNDAAEAAFAVETIAETFGPERGETAEFPITGAEDFSFVLEQVPGAFVMLGACPPGTDPETAPTNHSAVATFDDAALADGTALYVELALRRLARA
jgi:galactokinase